jgi:hypothetical protein
LIVTIATSPFRELGITSSFRKFNANVNPDAITRGNITDRDYLLPNRIDVLDVRRHHFQLLPGGGAVLAAWPGDPEGLLHKRENGRKFQFIR